MQGCYGNELYLFNYFITCKPFYRSVKINFDWLIGNECDIVEISLYTLNLSLFLWAFAIREVTSKMALRYS